MFKTISAMESYFNIPKWEETKDLYTLERLRPSHSVLIIDLIEFTSTS